MNDVNWKEHLPELNELFFAGKDCILKGSKTYDDFFAFFWRYLSFIRKKGIEHEAPKPNQENSAFEVTSENVFKSFPKTYNPQFCINSKVVSKTFEKKFGDKSDSYTRNKHGLTKKQLRDFESVILKYIDFTQKQSFNKLKKLHDQQSNLPIALHKDEILKAVAENQIVIVAGDTGCGKSTQVPQYLLNAGYSNISCTQPRRIAAISLSKRVSYETLNLFGTEVAYKIRFEGTRTKSTKILFLTEGLLLRQMQTDPLLEQYSVIILDEVHERHLHSDLLLGMFRKMLTERSDLKVILMSATINLDLFTEYFEKAPVIQVPGRLYPITIKYHPIPPLEQSSKSERLDPRPYVRILQGIDKKYPSNEYGDLLVFLSGMSEIQSVAEALSAYADETKRWIVLMLHSTLSVEEQDKVFDVAPDGVRKCILSTNIAETSVTIDGVRFICDSGKVKEMNYDDKYKMQKLQEFWISRASAEQRKGRAGRTGPGVCFRLYSDEDFESMAHYSTPEIRRVPLNSLLLQMKSMGIEDLREFQFIESPGADSINAAVHTLQDQGALDNIEKLTAIGHMLSQLPVDIVIGKMLIMGSLFDMSEPVMTIAATLSVQSPLTRNAYNNSEIAARRQDLESSHGDPFTLLNLYDEWIRIKREQKTSSKKWCQRRGLEEQRFYEMTNLKRQFRELLEESSLLTKDTEPEKKLVSSVERKKRHAERKRFADLKRKQNQESRKTKVLKMEDNRYEISEPGDERIDESDINDVKDLQFKLRHDLEKLYRSSSEARRLTIGDITMLKIILASGLYPQVAIGDDCNSYRREQEQVFHTRAKPFALLHPTGYFANHPDVLEPSGKADSSLHKTGTSIKKGLLSHKHQLLAFVSLLETMKPYVCNTMRVPALQTCLLFGRSLDTNNLCTRIIVDQWLEFTMPDPKSAQDIISATIHLRTAWESLLNAKLKKTKKNADAALEVQNDLLHTFKLQRNVALKLTEFLDSKVEYRFKRIRSAYINEMYVGQGSNISSKQQFNFTAIPHPIKGGMLIAKFLVHNCLKRDGNELANANYLQTLWTCPKCEITLPVSLIQRLEHENECGFAEEETCEIEDDANKQEVETEQNVLLKEYFCDICNEILKLSSVQILKHKRSHK